EKWVEIPHFVRNDSFSFLVWEGSAAKPHFPPPKPKTIVIPNAAKRNEESVSLITTTLKNK
ncbi:MAG: hypothetical protein WCL51_03470, partial [Bacteroidota bacterium]